MANEPATVGAETGQQKFERILARDSFQGLKAILDSLSPDRQALCDGVNGAQSYEDLLARLGYRVNLTRQIHIQDCYSRLGAKGGIRAVLPYHDIPTQSSLPTLVNLDSSVTTTAKSAAFFNGLLAQLRAQLTA